MEFKLIIFILGLSSCWAISRAQNLIPNHSFEQLEKCPNYFGKNYDPSGIRNFTKSWYAHGSVDYFTNCDVHNKLVPSNHGGFSYSGDGENYVGFIMKDYSTAKIHLNYREYVQTELIVPLERGKKYYFSVQAKKAEYSFGCVPRIGILMDKKKISSIKLEGFEAEPTIVFNTGDTLGMISDWVTLCATFVAQGNEKYLTIGNFDPLEKSNMARTPIKCEFDEQLEAVYYYFDDVHLVLVDSNFSSHCPSLQEQLMPASEIDELPIRQALDTTRAKQTFILRQVNFETSSWKLDSGSVAYLMDLSDQLKDLRLSNIEIQGHTDHTGTENGNLRLSQNRAEAVMEELVKNGIPAFQIIARGYGWHQPIADNESEKGRSINRRVELRLAR